jgi:phosphatidylinositol-3-phosphatase
MSLGTFGCGGGDDSSTPGGPGPEAGPDSTTSGEGGGPASPQLKHIFYIMMENHSRTEIVGNAQAPFITSLASQYGQATSYYGVTHPSSPNYLAAISGDFQGVWDDCKAGPDVTCAPEEFIPADAGGDLTSASLLTAAQASNAAQIPHWFSGRNIVDQLEANGKTWIAYMEGIPATGDTSEYWPYGTTDAGALDLTNPRKLYAQKHDPFMYFQDIRTNANRMSKIVPFTSFATDVAGTSVPNFVWISPNQCDDMHGITTANAAAVGIPGCDVDSTAIGIGDTFIKNTVTAIKASPAWAEGAAIVIVWDEDDYAGTAGCCNTPMGQTGYLGGANVPAIVISSLVTSPVTSTDPYNHYSLLATIESLWGFDCLGNACGMKGSQLMTKLFVPSASASDAGSTASDAKASETGADASDAGAPSDTGSPSSDASDAAAPSDAGEAGSSTPDASDAAAPIDAPTGG